MWDKIFFKLNLNLSSSQKKSLLIILIIAAALPFTIALVKQTQIFKPRAEESAQTHSVVNFDPKVEQVLSPGDTLSGKGIPEAKVSVSITPDGDSKEVDVDKDGKWTYQIPSSIQPKNYNLTIIINDIAGNIASIKSYSIKITSPTSVIPAKAGIHLTTLFDGSPIRSGMTLGIKPAYAQAQCNRYGQTCYGDNDCRDGSNECQNFVCSFSQFITTGGGICTPPQATPTPTPQRELEPIGSEDQARAARMKRLSIYMAKDKRTGETVYVSGEEFKEQVCNNDEACVSPHYDEFIDGIKNNNFQYIIALGNKLRESPNCYIAFEALQPYFPNANDFFDGERFGLFSTVSFPSLSYMYQNPLGCQENQIKHQIDENTLSGLILDTAKDYSQNTDDPNHDFFTTTETASLGFLPVSTMLKLYALNDGYRGDSALVADTAFAVSGIIPIGKAGVAVKQVSKLGSHTITSRTVLETYRLSQDIGPIHRRLVTLQKSERISQEAIQSEIDNVLTRNLVEVPIRPTTIPPSGIVRLTSEQLLNEGELVRLYGQRLGRGQNGVVYGDGTIATKISHLIPNRLLEFEKESLERANGCCGLPRLLEEIQDESGNLAGFSMEQIHGSTLSNYTGMLSLDKRMHFLEDLARAHEVTGRTHGDIASVIHVGLVTDSSSNLDNIIVEAGTGRLRMIDYGGFPIINTYMLQNELRGVVELFFMGMFPSVEATAETRAIGSRLIDLIQEGKTLHEALNNLRNNPVSPARGLIEITGIFGQGNTRLVSFVVHDGGISENPDQFDVTFALEQTVNQVSWLIKNANAYTQDQKIPLKSQKIGSGLFRITLPELSAGNYNLVASLFRSGSTTELDEDGEPISGLGTIPQPTPQPTSTSSSRTVTSIKINGQDALGAMEVGHLTLNIHLPGVEGIPGVYTVPVEVTYSDGNSKSFVLTFKYLNDLSNAEPPSNFNEPGEGNNSPSPTPLPESTPRCGLTANNSSYSTSIAPGNYISFNLTNIPEGASSATWLGTGGSVPSSIDPFTILPGRVWNKILGPYGESSTGNYTRKIVVSDINGEALCQSNTVNITVSGSISTPGQYILPGNPCGSASPHPELRCQSGYSCSSAIYGTCQLSNTSGTIPTPLPVSVVNPTSIPTPTPSCKRVNQSCNLDTDCCQNQGLRCLLGSGSSKVCR